MNKLTIPSILAATVLIAGIFAFMPVEKASTVHVTIGDKIDDLQADVAALKADVAAVKADFDAINANTMAPANRTLMLTDDGSGYHRYVHINLSQIRICINGNQCRCKWNWRTITVEATFTLMQGGSDKFCWNIVFDGCRYRC